MLYLISMNKEIDTSDALPEDPYMNLGVLDPTQIKVVDSERKLYQLAKDSPVLIEGIGEYGIHDYLAKILLQEEITAVLESVGRNIRNPISPTNVVGTFKYSLAGLVGSAKRLKTRSWGKPPVWAQQITPIEIFFARHDYIGVAYPSVDLSKITDIHVITNLAQDPRAGFRNPSKNFRYVK